MTAAAAPVADRGWDRLARCASGGDWAGASGDGRFGGLRFTPEDWSARGGTAFAPRADQATREQQVVVAGRVRDTDGGYAAWPDCAARLGLPA